MAKQNVTFRARPATIEWVKQFASSNGDTMSATIAEAVEQMKAREIARQTGKACDPRASCYHLGKPEDMP